MRVTPPISAPADPDPHVEAAWLDGGQMSLEKARALALANDP